MCQWYKDMHCVSSKIKKILQKYGARDTLHGSYDNVDITVHICYEMFHWVY